MLSVVFSLWPSFFRMARVAAAAVVRVLILILHFYLQFLKKGF